MILSAIWKIWTGAHFTTDFSIVIQIQLKFHYALIQVVMQWSLWNFCTWHDSCAVVVCKKFCTDMIPYNGVTLKPNFHRICITMEYGSWNWPLITKIISKNLKKKNNQHCSWGWPCNNNCYSICKFSDVPYFYRTISSRVNSGSAMSSQYILLVILNDGRQLCSQSVNFTKIFLRNYIWFCSQCSVC